MRHDYNLPSEWESMTSSEKCRWYTLERARRQVIRQKEAGSMPFLDFFERKEITREVRKDRARSETVSLQDYR